MLETTLAGSLPKPSWLAEPLRLWAPWQVEDETRLNEAKRDAVRLSLAEQEEAGIDIVSDGEQSRQHFVHGFLEGISGIDFVNKKRIGIRDNRYDADCPTVVGPVRRNAPVHLKDAQYARAHTKKRLKFTLPGPMTIVDTLADSYYGDRIKMAMDFAALLNQEARDLADAGIDVVQFDEPAYNVYMAEVRTWGIETLERAIEGLNCKTAVHICYGYGIDANRRWKETLGDEWRQYEDTFPVLAASQIDQISIECANSHVPMSLIALLKGKDVLVGSIDVTTNDIESPEQVAAVIREALQYVAPEHLVPCTNCGMVPLTRSVALGKLRALAEGAAIVRAELQSA